MPKHGKKKAAAAVAQPEPLQKYSHAALKVKAKAEEAHAKLLDEAVAHCIDNNVSPYEAARLERFSALDRNQIVYHMKRSKRSERAILTKTEESKIYDWMRKSADNGNPVTEPQLGDQILKILKARLAHNRAKDFGFGCVRLSKAEKALVHNNKHPSHKWLQGFKAEAANNNIDYKAVKPKDSKRQKKQNEHTVEHHFFGPFGLEAELLSVNNLDPATKQIKDPRRLLNADEMPQFLDFIANGKLTRAFGRHGVKLEKSAPENRETATLMTAADLSGFLYGMQGIVGRKYFTLGMADCCDAPETAMSFDDSIYLADGKSTYGLLSKSDNGIQTAATFREFLHWLVDQIKHRSRLEVEAGRPAIEFPVTLMLDNHSSRFDETVLAECSREDLVGEAHSLGVSLFFEESNTSHILQMLDKIFEKLHAEYRRGLKEYKAQHKAMYVCSASAYAQAAQAYVCVRARLTAGCVCRYGDEVDIGIPEFLEVLGGCKALGLEGIWFSWCSKRDIIAAWRHVGIIANRLDPSQIDRSNFIDRVIAEEEAATSPTRRETRQQTNGRSPDPHATPRSIEEAVKTPDGMRSNDVEALKVKVARLTKLARSQEKAGFDPTVVPGVLEPNVAPVKKRQRDRSRASQSEGGSARLRNLHGETVEKREAAEKKQDEVQQRKEAQQEKRELAAEAERVLRAAFELCQRGCVCGEQPCKVQGYKQCEVCKEVKRRVCTKRACVAARQPLMLTYVGRDDDAGPSDVDAAVEEEGEEEEMAEEDEE